MMTLFFLLSSTAFAQTATYTVPVADAALLPHATYLVEAKNDYGLGSDTLSYTLPEALTGQKLPITMKRNASGEWLGDGVEGKCSARNSALVCDVRFASMPVNEERVKVILEQQGFSPSEVAAKLQISRIFAKEPIGIVEIKAR